MVRTVLALIGMYVAGVAVGAVIAMVNRSAVDSVAIATASPTAAATLVAIATATPPPPTQVPTTPTPVPLPATPTPATAAPATPTSAPATPTVAPPTPTVAPSVSAAADPADIPAFIDELGQAISQGTDGFLFNNLHPAVLDRYGEQQCRRFARDTRSEGLDLEYISANGPAPWDWELDERTTPIADAWTVTLQWHDPSVDEQRDVHIAPSDGTWRWFTDCGDPRT